jgi:hypothetical protein
MAPHRRKDFRVSYDWTANGATLSPYDAYLVAAWNLGSTTDQAGANTLTNDGCDFISGKYGNCADFEAGDTDEMYVAAMGADLQPTSKMALSFWMMLESQPASDYAIFAAENGSYYNFHLQYSWSAGAGRFFWHVRQSNGTDKSVTVSSHTLTLATWYHIICVANGSNLKIYENGSQIGAATAYDGTIEADAGAFRFGNRKGGDWYDGCLNAAYFYNGVDFSDAAIQALYNGGTGSFYTG